MNRLPVGKEFCVTYMMASKSRKGSQTTIFALCSRLLFWTVSTMVKSSGSRQNEQNAETTLVVSNSDVQCNNCLIMDNRRLQWTGYRIVEKKMRILKEENRSKI